MTTYTELSDLAESLVPTAARLVGAVHDDGPAAVARVLAGVPTEHLPAFTVVLAAMVDPNKSPRDLLGWVDRALQPRNPAPTLFAGVAEPDDPRSWPDDLCHRLYLEARRVPDGTPRDEALLTLGRREWDRRIKERTRQTPIPTRPGC